MNGSKDDKVNLESIKKFADYYILDDSRYEAQSSLRIGKPTQVRNDDQLIMDGGSGNGAGNSGGNDGDGGTNELPVNRIIPEEDLPEFPGEPVIPGDILEGIQDIIDGQPVDPDFGVEPVPPEVIDELNDFIDQLSVDPDFDVDPGDGQIDNNSIDPDPEDGDGLRVVDIVREPLKSGFEEDVRGKKPDTVIENASVDRLTRYDKSDILKCKKGKDYLYGDNGPDPLIPDWWKSERRAAGRKCKDALISKTGKDILYSGNKKDVMTGNQGSDVLILFQAMMSLQTSR